MPGVSSSLSGRFYSPDLARLHSEAYSGMSVAAGRRVLDALHAANIKSGRIVDLGCGSGEWLAAASRAGFETIGVDRSAAMIRRAASVSPTSHLVEASLYEFEIPDCVVVTAFGEGLCYGVSHLPTDEAIAEVIARVRSAIQPGGLFVFDLIVDGVGGADGADGVDAGPMEYRSWSETKDQIVLIDVQEDETARAVTRRITLLTKDGDGYRRVDEVHKQRVFNPDFVREELEASGFRVNSGTKYGEHRLGRRRRAFFATAPE